MEINLNDSRQTGLTNVSIVSFTWSNLRDGEYNKSRTDCSCFASREKAEKFLRSEIEYYYYVECEEDDDGLETTEGNYDESNDELLKWINRQLETNYVAQEAPQYITGSLNYRSLTYDICDVNVII